MFRCRDQFLLPNCFTIRDATGNDQVNRQRIEQLIGKMNAGKRRQLVDRFEPGNFATEVAQIFLLSLPPNQKRLQYHVGGRSETFSGRLAQRAQHICCKNAIVRPLLHDGEVVRPSQLLPYLDKLRGQQFSEQRPNTDIGKKIAMPPDAHAPTGIITMLRMIKRQLHEAGERDWPIPFDLATNKLK